MEKEYCRAIENLIQNNEEEENRHDNTIEIEIDANDSGELYLGQVGKEEYTKE